MSRTSIGSSTGPCSPVPRRSGRSKTSSTATVRVSSWIPSDTAGASPPTSRTWRPTRWPREPPKSWPAELARRATVAGQRQDAGDDCVVVTAEVVATTLGHERRQPRLELRAEAVGLVLAEDAQDG